MKKILSILAIGIVTAFSVQAQSSPIYYHLKQGAAADTIHKSTTLFTAPVSVLSAKLMAVNIQVAMDSVSGTPDTKFVLQRSVDATHWYSIAGDTLSPTYNGLKTVNASEKHLDVNPYYSAWVRVKYYTGSGTQKSKVWVTVKAVQIY